MLRHSQKRGRASVALVAACCRLAVGGWRLAAVYMIDRFSLYLYPGAKRGLRAWPNRAASHP